MGYILPSPSSTAEQARALMAQKDDIEAQLTEHLAVLRANGTNMTDPLLDREGFPRADMDLWAVRLARQRIIELRNDLSATMDAIGQTLEHVYDPAALREDEDEPQGPSVRTADLAPFARVNSVAPSSPAADAGLLREDLVLKFGELQKESFDGTSLQPLSDLVAASENKVIRVTVKRGADQTVILTLTPRQGWGGRGMLGCHLVPYSS